VRLRAALALLIVLALAPAARGQQRDTRQFMQDPLTVSADLVDAIRLLNVNPEAALAMLHKLNTRFPGRDDILTRLAYAHQVTGSVDSATVFYRQALSANPLNLEAGKSLGSIYYADGREKEAMAIFNGLIASNNYSVTSYKMVAGAMRDLGRPDEAIILLEQGRQRSTKNGALTLEIATYYRQMGDNRRAMDEYFRYTEIEPRSYRFVRDRMLETVRDAEKDRDALLAYLKNRVERGEAQGVIAADVLATHYLERGLLEQSLEMALRADNNKLSDGSALLTLGEEAGKQAAQKPRAQRGRYYDLARRALEGYTQGHAKAPQMDRARFNLAGVYAACGSGENSLVLPADRPAYLQRAADEYATVSRQYPSSEFAEDAYIARGDVLLRKLKRPDEALAVYKSGAVNSHQLPDVFAGRIAEVYIGTGRSQDTEPYLRGLMQSRNADLAEAGQYYAGLDLAIHKKYDLARDTLTALAEAAPASRFTNDAIETAWAIEEGLQLQSPSLDDLFAARKAEMVGDTTIATTRLQAIVGREVHDPLRPRALEKLGLLLFESGDSEAALVAMRRFVDEYPEHDQAPAVRRSLGRVYEVGLGQYAQALKEYEQVLMTYPQYAMLDEVRQDVLRCRQASEGAAYAP